MLPPSTIDAAAGSSRYYRTFLTALHHTTYMKTALKSAATRRHSFSLRRQPTATLFVRRRQYYCFANRLSFSILRQAAAFSSFLLLPFHHHHVATEFLAPSQQQQSHRTFFSFGMSSSTHTTERDGPGTVTVSPKNEADQSGLIVICHGLGDTAEGTCAVHNERRS